jgi:hypothetical protein
MLQQLKQTGVESMSARSESKASVAFLTVSSLFSNWNIMLVLYCESSFKCLPLYLTHVSLVGCNLASNNPTDDNTSTYGAEMFIGWSYTRFVFLALIGNPTWFLPSLIQICFVVSEKKMKM